MTCRVARGCRLNFGHRACRATVAAAHAGRLRGAANVPARACGGVSSSKACFQVPPRHRTGHVLRRQRLAGERAFARPFDEGRADRSSPQRKRSCLEKESNSWNAIDAAEVAAVGDGDAEIRDGPAERVDHAAVSRRSPIQQNRHRVHATLFQLVPPRLKRNLSAPARRSKSPCEVEESWLSPGPWKSGCRRIAAC